MPPINLSDYLIRSAKKAAKESLRSPPKQIEHWVKIGRLAEKNPKLSYNDIIETMEREDE